MPKLTYKDAFAMWEESRDNARELQSKHMLAIKQRDEATKLTAEGLVLFDKNLKAQSAELVEAISDAQNQIEALVEKLDGLRAEHAEAHESAASERQELETAGRTRVDELNVQIEKLNGEHLHMRQRTDGLARQLPELLHDEVRNQ